MTPGQLAVATGCRNMAQAEAWLPAIEAAMEAYGINTHPRMAMFLANIGHESGGLRWVKEIWGPTPTQARYEGRKDLGNTQPGDGRKYRGHGLIQITGRYNHARVRDRLRAKFPDKNVPDFEETPDLLSAPEWAALSAADFWDDKSLNVVADSGDFDAVCDIINRGRKTTVVGDANGYFQRLLLWSAAKKVLA